MFLINEDGSPLNSAVQIGSGAELVQDVWIQLSSNHNLKKKHELES